MQKQLAFIVLSAAVGMASAQSGPVTLHVGDSAPPLVIAKWAKGQPISKLGDGKVNIVEFWATWCGPCKVSIPHITELAKKYKDKANFIGVDSFEHDPNAATCYPKVEKFVADFGDKMDYNVAIDGVEGTMGKTWMDASGQNGIPTAFVVDQKGKIAWIGHPMQGLDEVVGKVIDGKFDLKVEAERQRKEQETAQAAAAAQQKYIGPIMAARNAKKFKEEVAAIDKASAADPRLKQMLTNERFSAMSQYDEVGAQKYAAQLADGQFKDDIQSLNSIAWAMVEDKSPIKHLDTALAIRIAEKAAKLSKNDPMICDTLALAYYRAHRVADALKTQKTAVEKYSADTKADDATLKEMKERLALYEKAGK